MDLHPGDPGTPAENRDDRMYGCGPQPVQKSSRPVTQCCAWATSKYGGHVTATHRKRRVTHGIDTGMNRMEPSGFDSMRRPVFAVAEGPEVRRRDYAVLPPGDGRNSRSDCQWAISVAICATQIAHWARVALEPAPL